MRARIGRRPRPAHETLVAVGVADRAVLAPVLATATMLPADHALVPTVGVRARRWRMA